MSPFPVPGVTPPNWGQQLIDAILDLVLDNPGPAGERGWSPQFAVVADGARRVLQIVDWVGGEGTKPSVTLQFVGAAGIVNSAAAAIDIRGAAGTNGTDGIIGTDGWSPIFAIASDGARRVLQIIDWTGGTGTEPSSTNQFIGPTGIVGTAAAAVDIRGAAGAAGGGGLPATWFDVANYGAAQDGVADDTSELQAALTAAYNAGGGLVIFSGRLKITGPVTVWRGVSLRGVARTDSLDDVPSSTIIMSGATAKLTVGQGNRSGTTGSFLIDCAGSGDPNGVLEYTGVWHTLRDIMIENPAGIGFSVKAAQNTHFESIDVQGAGTHGLVIDDGAGGLKFTRCSFGSSTGWDIKVTETTPGSHPTYGYQYGPAHITFDTCITENYQSTACEGLVLLEAGTRITFRNHGFSNSSDHTFNSGYQIMLKNDKYPTLIGTTVEFDSCNYHGGNTKKYPVFHVQGTNTAKNNLLVTGYSAFQFSTSIFNTDGASSGDFSGYATYSTITAIWGTSGSPLWNNWRIEKRNGMFFRMPDASGAYAGMQPLLIGKDTDNGARFFLANTGQLLWGGGTNFTPTLSASPDTTNNLLDISGVKHSGKFVQSMSLATVSVAGTALTTTCSAIGPIYVVLLNSVGSIASWTLSGPVDGQELEIWITRAGAQTFVWPTNIKWEGAAAPSTAPTANQYTIVHLRYVSSGANWYEHKKRIIGVPN